MKKLISIIVTAVVALSLAACGASSAPAPAETQPAEPETTVAETASAETPAPETTTVETTTPEPETEPETISLSEISAAQSTGETLAGTAYDLYSDIPYTETGYTGHLLDVYIPNGDAPAEGRPVMLYFHGGGYIRGTKQDQGETIQYAMRSLDNDMVFVAVNYRLPNDDSDIGAPNEENQATTEQVRMMIDDVQSAVNYVVENAPSLQVNTDKLVLEGASAGGGLAVYAGLLANNENQPKIAAVVAMAPGLAQIVRPEDYSIAYIDDCLDEDDPPFYIAGGTEDNVVAGGELIETFFGKLEKVGLAEKSMYDIVEGAQHVLPSQMQPENLYVVMDRNGNLNEGFDWLMNILK